MYELANSVLFVSYSKITCRIQVNYQWTPQPARNQKIFGPPGETPCLLGPLPVFISLELGAVAESYPCPKTGITPIR
jgi:hypothetical protein